MNKTIAKRVFSIIFLTIFMLKMVISLAPFIVAHFSQITVNAVIMQLEIENNSKTTDIKEITVKEYFTQNYYGFALAHQVPLILPSMISFDHDKHVQSFYPPVPTPPPNV